MALGCSPLLHRGAGTWESAQSPRKSGCELMPTTLIFRFLAGICDATLLFAPFGVFLLSQAVNGHRLILLRTSVSDILGRGLFKPLWSSMNKWGNGCQGQVWWTDSTVLEWDMGVGGRAHPVYEPARLVWGAGAVDVPLRHMLCFSEPSPGPPQVSLPLP